MLIYSTERVVSFEDSLSLVYGCFRSLLPLHHITSVMGKGGSVQKGTTKRLMCFYDQRFAQSSNLKNFLFSQKMRHTTCQEIAKLRGGNRGGQMAVDTKGVGKPNVFDSDPKRWHPFSFRYANYADALFKGAAALLEWAAEQDDEITELSGAVGLVDDVDEVNRQLYTSLASMADGEALDITRNTPTGQGLEVWRRLNKRYDPLSAGRSTTKVTQILRPGQYKVSELSGAVERWEEKLRLHARRTKTPMPDLYKRGTLIDMCPADLRKHLHMNSNRFKTYEAIKEEIDSYLESTQDGGASPMEIGSMLKGGGTKGAKGEGKGSKFQGNCYNCGKPNHRASECWQKGNQENKT